MCWGDWDVTERQNDDDDIRKWKQPLFISVLLLLTQTSKQHACVDYSKHSLLYLMSHSNRVTWNRVDDKSNKAYYTKWLGFDKSTFAKSGLSHQKSWQLAGLLAQSSKYVTGWTGLQHRLLKNTKQWLSWLSLYK